MRAFRGKRKFFDKGRTLKKEEKAKDSKGEGGTSYKGLHP